MNFVWRQWHDNEKYSFMFLTFYIGCLISILRWGEKMGVAQQAQQTQPAENAALWFALMSVLLSHQSHHHELSTWNHGYFQSDDIHFHGLHPHYHSNSCISLWNVVKRGQYIRLRFDVLLKNLTNLAWNFQKNAGFFSSGVKFAWVQKKAGDGLH